MSKEKDLKIGMYKHYKGNLYEVLGVGHHSETEEPMVVYKALYENDFGKNSLWVRPYSMFVENVKINGETQPRFKYLREST